MSLQLIDFKCKRKPAKRCVDISTEDHHDEVCCVFEMFVTSLCIIHIHVLTLCMLSVYDNHDVLYRGHSRNRPKGGRTSAQRYTSTRFADNFPHFFAHKEFRSLLCLRSIICCILYKTSVNSLR